MIRIDPRISRPIPLKILTWMEMATSLARSLTRRFFQIVGGEIFPLWTRNLGGGSSNIFYVHPYLGKIPILTNIFQMGWFNHQLETQF